MTGGSRSRLVAALIDRDHSQGDRNEHEVRANIAHLGYEDLIGQLRAAVLSDLVRRPWDDSRPPITAHLHLSAALPALDGHVGCFGIGRPGGDLAGLERDGQ